MLIQIDDSLYKICHYINSMNKDVDEWSKIESSNYFQIGHYCGGFDSIENAFCFSYYKDNKEFWFQLSLDKIKNILHKEIDKIEVRPADD